MSLDGEMMATPVRLSPDAHSLEVGTPAVLFPVRIAGAGVLGTAKQQYAVSSDGQRFLVNLDIDEGATPPITLILNWKGQAMTFTAGTKLGPYEILTAIGAGGQGEVYKARDTRLNRTVGIKVVPRLSPTIPK